MHCRLRDSSRRRFSLARAQEYFTCPELTRLLPLPCTHTTPQCQCTRHRPSDVVRHPGSATTVCTDPSCSRVASRPREKSSPPFTRTSLDELDYINVASHFGSPQSHSQTRRPTHQPLEEDAAFRQSRVCAARYQVCPSPPSLSPCTVLPPPPLFVLTGSRSPSITTVPTAKVQRMTRHKVLSHSAHKAVTWLQLLRAPLQGERDRSCTGCQNETRRRGERELAGSRTQALCGSMFWADPFQMLIVANHAPRGCNRTHTHTHTHILCAVVKGRVNQWRSENYRGRGFGGRELRI